MAIINVRQLNVEEANRYAGGLDDPARLASAFAGVAGNMSSNGIVVRGNAPKGMLWNLEGIEIANPSHFANISTFGGGGITALSSQMLANSDFYTGAFPAEYGNAMSGVFDLKMRNGNNEKREYLAQVGLNGFEFGMEGPFNRKSEKPQKASFLLNYRYSTLEVFNALGISFGVSAIPQYQDISFKINIPGTKWGTFSVFGIGGKSYIGMYNSKRKASDWSFGQSGNDALYGSDMGAAGISHLLFFDSTSRLKTTFAISGSKAATRADSAYTDRPPRTFYRDNSYEVVTSLTSQYWKKFSSRDNMSAGFTAELYSIHYVDSLYLKQFRKVMPITDVTGKNIALLQAFIQERHRFTGKLSFYGGVHGQFFTLNRSFAIEPRASLAWNFAPGQTFSLGAGMHSQLQPRLFYFLRTNVSDSLSFMSNKNLGFSKSDQLVLSYDYNFAPNWRMKGEAYCQNLRKIPVESRPSVFSIINYGSEFYGTRADSLVNSGTGRNYGLEFTLEKFLSDNYYMLLTASLFDSKYKGSDGVERNTIYNGNFVVNLLGGYSLKLGKFNSLSIDMKTVKAGGKRFIPIDLQASRLKGEKVYLYAEAYRDRFPDYFRLDGRITLKLNFRKASTEFAFDVQNITDRKNVFLVNYNPGSGLLKYDYHLGTFYLALWRILF